VPSGYSVNGYQLGSWVNIQRQSHRKGELSAEREIRLQALPGWTWDPFAAKWEEGFSHLLRFVEHNGHARVPYTDVVDEYPLGQWVYNQRSKHAKHALDADREQRLQCLPGWTWDPSAAQWDESFSRLLDFVEEYGHARVPHSYIADCGFKLGYWASNQRQKHAKGALEPDREARLESLPGWAWNAR
ncbi:MAG: helicase associated domain-containing protein, partial [Caldilineaceae bacterium]|nr:helicase associated domain-containing protein [Caldilineaceae bacterium]